MKTFTQTFTTDLHEAAIARYAGYEVRWLPNEQQWAIRNPGDLEDLFADVRAGVADNIQRCRVPEDVRRDAPDQVRRARGVYTATNYRRRAGQRVLHARHDWLRLHLSRLVIRFCASIRQTANSRNPRFFFADDGSAMKVARGRRTAKMQGRMERPCDCMRAPRRRHDHRLGLLRSTGGVVVLRNGHRVWSTPEILQGDMTLRCNDCVLEAAQRLARQERSRLADELLAAGRENDQEYEDLIAEERKTQ